MKTKAERLAEMDSIDPTGRNQAVQNHRAKILAMNDEEYALHIDRLAKLKVKSEATVQRFVREFFPKK